MLASAVFLSAAASAAPIPPQQDKAGALLKYQVLTPPDRRATLDAFMGRKLSDGAFTALDACTLRQATEDNAGRVKLSATIAACAKETGN